MAAVSLECGKNSRDISIPGVFNILQIRNEKPTTGLLVVLVQLVRIHINVTYVYDD